MPFSQHAVALDPGPGCIRQARTWTATSLRALDREDLIEAAELGVAELVGNALLHAHAPIRLRMRGTREHPRIEVTDGSTQLPVPYRATIEDDLLTTVGRGLGIVSMVATAWGAESVRGGKVVWFEPAAAIADRPHLEGDIVGADDAGSTDTDLADGVPVTLRQLPVSLYAAYQLQHQELRRELRLLALAHGDTYPIATSISRAIRAFEDQLRRASGLDALERALERDSNGDSIDLTLVVPSDLPYTASRMVDMLELADTFCRSERLLSLATPPEQRTFRRWYLGEFVRQGEGESPTPWSADLHAMSGDA